MRFAGEWSVAPSAGLSLLPPELIRGNGNSYEIGEPPVRDAEESGGVSDHIILEDYPARPTPTISNTGKRTFPRFPLTETPSGTERRNRKNRKSWISIPVRRENIKHAILERMRVVDDLEPALRHLTVDGTLLPDMVDEIRESLRHKLSDPDVSRWFGRDVRVIAERPLLHRGSMLRRPDRIVVFPDGHAELVDYKFGKVRKDKRYARQVRRYVELLKSTGLFPESLRLSFGMSTRGGAVRV